MNGTSGLTALILDPPSTERSTAYERFQTIGTAEFGWRFTRIPNLSLGMDGHQWINTVRAEIERASILIGLGNYPGFFFQLGDRALEIARLIVTRARDGVPILLQCARLRERLNGDEQTQSVLEMLRAFEVQPTDIKVGSDDLAFAGHSSPYTCWFMKGDNCLRDPLLFSGINQILIDQPNLLDYDGDAFPIIDSSAMHYFVDAGDFFTAGAPGRHATVGIVRRIERQLQIVLSGIIFDEETETIGGKILGIEINEEFARRVIRSLNDAASSPSRHVLNAYELFNRLERRLGQLVKAVLDQADPVRGVAAFLPEDLKKKLAGKIGKVEYHMAGYFEIVQIIKYNWPIFGARFSDLSLENFESSFGSLNKRQRRLLAHPHRAEELGIEFTDSDVAVLKRALLYLAKAEDVRRTS